MAGRPPLGIGESGEFWFKTLGPKKVRAYCGFRDFDGKTRQVEATGESESAARRKLKAKLATRSAPASDDLTGDTKVRLAGERWFKTTILTAVEAGERSPATAAAYRGLLDRHIYPAIGEWRLREASTGKIDRVLSTIREKSGASTAKSCRTVLSGILSYAVRQDAITGNATRNTSPIPTKPSRQPRALTVDEVAQWLQRLAQDEAAIRHDMLDLTAWMLATGVRIGEALAVSWKDVDLLGQPMVVDGARRRVCTAKVDWTIIRVTGKGLLRKTVKTTAGLRTLRLPEFAVAMLRRRAVELFVLRTGYVPAPQESLRELCGCPSELCTILRRSRSGSETAGQTQHDADSADIEDLASCVNRAAVAARELGETPVFPDTRGGWRDPSNTRRDLRSARGKEFSWVTSHSFRKTAATMLDEAGLTARQIANQLGHSRISLTQDVYLARVAVDPQAAAALEQGLRGLFSMDKPWTDLRNDSQDTA